MMNCHVRQLADAEKERQTNKCGFSRNIVWLKPIREWDILVTVRHGGRCNSIILLNCYAPAPVESLKIKITDITKAYKIIRAKPTHGLDESRFYRFHI